jgi:hypothetical protein
MIFERLLVYRSSDVGSGPLATFTHVDLRQASTHEFYAYQGDKLVAMIHTCNRNPIMLTDRNDAWIIVGILEEVIDGVLQPLMRSPNVYGNWLLTPYRPSEKEVAGE